MKKRDGKNEKSGKTTKKKNTARLEAKESNIFEIFDIQKENNLGSFSEEKRKRTQSRSRASSRPEEENRSSFPMDEGKPC